MTPIDAIANGIRMGAGQNATSAKPSTGGGADLFGDTFHSAAQQIGKLDNDAQSAVTGLLSGQGVEVHDAMIATQKSELAFELALQVRNKAVAAYQQMMQMQF
jgi:flagellar hook-basal body complex protein FliE